MHYFALRKNDVAIAELLRVGGCMCIRNYAGQNAIDVRKTEELHMLASNLPVAVVVFMPSATPTMRIHSISNVCRKPRMTPSRDYDEQRLGILYSLLKSEYLR